MVEQKGLDRVFSALAHPDRRAMLERLTTGDLSIGDLADPLPMSFAAASKHVAVLERAGLVERTVRGRRHVLRLVPGPLVSAHDWFGVHERYWTSRLDTPDGLAGLLATPP